MEETSIINQSFKLAVTFLEPYFCPVLERVPYTVAFLLSMFSPMFLGAITEESLSFF